MTIIERLRRNPGASAIAVVGFVALIFIVNARSRLATLDAQESWLATAGLLIIGLAIIGSAVSGRPAGVLIDNRNRVSLSKFQATMWTILILSALITAAAVNVNGDVVDPLQIRIHSELLVAMGISAASLAATPMLLSLKTDATPSPDAPARIGAEPADAAQPPCPPDAIFTRAAPTAASWADMFRGDETSNAGHADLSKVQQFLISLLLVALYAAAVWTMFGKFGQIRSLPPLSEHFVWLMGISHASYLAYKAAPHGSAGSRGGSTPAPESVG